MLGSRNRLRGPAKAMCSKHDDQLVLAHLALIDMERVQKDIEYLRSANEKDLRAALFRDAVVSYAKPFSNNRYHDGTKGLCISSNHVPQDLKSTHHEVLALRDQLVAHTDMTLQKPQVDKRRDDAGPNFSLGISGYETIHKEHLIEPLLKLAQAIHTSLLRGRSDQVKNNF